MIDIVERLRAYGKLMMPYYPDDLCSKAAAEIEKLRLEIDTLDDCCEKSAAEIEQLRAEFREMVDASADLVTRYFDLCEENERLRAENEQLRFARRVANEEVGRLRAKIAVEERLGK